MGIGSMALASLLDERLFAATPDRARRSARRAPAALRAEGEARSSTCSWRGRRRRSTSSTRSRSSSEHDGQAIPEELVKGERFAFIKGTPRLLGSPYAFEKCGQSGIEVSSLLPRFRDHRRRDGDRALRAHDAVQPRAGADLHEHRPPDRRPAVDGLVAELRARQREPRPPRLRRPRLGRERPRRRQELLGQRLSPDRPPGGRVPQLGRPRALLDGPGGRRPRGPARLARRAARAQRARASPRPAIPRSRRASPRTSSPTACRRACRS